MQLRSPHHDTWTQSGQTVHMMRRTWLLPLCNVPTEIFFVTVNVDADLIYVCADE